EFKRVLPAAAYMPQENDPSNGSPPPADATPPGGSGRRTFEVGPGRPTETSGFHKAAVPPRIHVESHPTGKRLAILSLGSLGVVYGDIGTSPLYAMQAAFTGEHKFAATESAVYGVLSMMVWSLVIVVALKYIYFILRADNRGEGGVLALLALILQ